MLVNIRTVVSSAIYLEVFDGVHGKQWNEADILQAVPIFHSKDLPFWHSDTKAVEDENYHRPEM